MHTTIHARTLATSQAITSLNPVESIDQLTKLVARVERGQEPRPTFTQTYNDVTIYKTIMNVRSYNVKKEVHKCLI
jgi:hypothetical protein